MDIRGRTPAPRIGGGHSRVLHLFALLLVLATAGGCRREGAPVEAPRHSPRPATVDRSAPVPPPVAVPTPAGGGADDGAGAPYPSGEAGLPAPTLAASSAAATSTAREPPILRAVRIGAHAGHDRVVFEFSGEGLPAWRVEYLDRPATDCGAGQAVPVAGDARLQVRFSGAHAHNEAGQSTSGPARRVANQPALRELVRTCDFEAEVTWVAGLSRARPYTARVLGDPARLVLDVAH